MGEPIRNLVFEGGGVCGVAYGGALEVLEDYGILNTLENVAGSSVGSLAAAMLALGFDAFYIKQRLTTLEFADLADSSFGVLRDLVRLITQYGWHKGDRLEAFVRSLLTDANLPPDTTFRRLEEANLGPALHVTASSLNLGKTLIFSATNTPDYSVVKALRASASFPLFFTPIKHGHYDYLVDGGLLNNYPIRLFDTAEGPNPFSVGLRVDNSFEVKSRHIPQTNGGKEITSFFSFISRLIYTLYDEVQNQHIGGQDWKRSIVIDTGNIQAMDFRLNQSDIDMMLNNGRRAALEFLALRKLDHD
jgi:NTE family protein